MSAVPLAALAFVGTEDAPYSVAFILSAKAGPAKAAVAPSTSVANMVVFEMLFFLLASSDDVSSQNNEISFFIPKGGLNPGEFSGSLWWQRRPYWSKNSVG